MTKVQDEFPLTHIERMDELQLKHTQELNLATIKENAETEREKIKLKRAKLERWKAWDDSLQFFFGIVGVIAAVFGVIFGIWWMWASSPSDTFEEMKQERWSDCVYYNGDEDKPQYTWWPTAEGGQGLCLPKGEKPPGTP